MKKRSSMKDHPAELRLGSSLPFQTLIVFHTNKVFTWCWIGAYSIFTRITGHKQHISDCTISGSIIFLMLAIACEMWIIYEISSIMINWGIFIYEFSVVMSKVINVG